MKHLIISISVLLILNSCNIVEKSRTEVSLNGTWELSGTDLTSKSPTLFEHQVQVPGLVDMAIPVPNIEMEELRIVADIETGNQIKKVNINGLILHIGLSFGGLFVFILLKLFSYSGFFVVTAMHKYPVS